MIPPASSTESLALLSKDPLHCKTVSLGRHEPAALVPLARCALPSLVLAVLLIDILAFGQSLTREYAAVALATFIISCQIFTDLDLHSGAHVKPLSVSRILLEWSCVVAALCFLAMSLKLNQRFPRELILAWFLTTPIVLVLASSMTAPRARWIAATSLTTPRYIIIGANDVGMELARRVGSSMCAGQFSGFFDHRSAGRLCESTRDRLAGNGKDVADFVRRNNINVVYIALPISTAPRIEELLNDLRDTTASIYFVPNIFAFDLMQARCVEINGMPVFSICESPLRGMSGMWKRSLDVTLARCC